MITNCLETRYIIGCTLCSGEFILRLGLKWVPFDWGLSSSAEDSSVSLGGRRARERPVGMAKPGSGQIKSVQFGPSQ